MASQKRIAKITRKTNETDIRIKLDIEGIGASKIDTGIPFLNHLLEAFSRHGFFDLELNAKGDIDVDIHHTNEDIGICMGEAFKRAVGSKKGINRFGFYYIVMDEALVRIVLDFSGRPSLYFTGSRAPKSFKSLKAAEGYSFNYLKQFLYAFCIHAGVNMNVGIEAGEDMHHIIEAVFKAFGRALRMATDLNARTKGIPSTKGKL